MTTTSQIRVTRAQPGQTEGFIGSSPDADIQITGDPYISARHARITCLVAAGRRPGEGAVFTIGDMASSNGTWVHRAGLEYRVRPGAPMTLLPGDTIQIGQTMLPFEGGS
jgi:pSer/pThr/pTyr-binding forkhead associated (FHA) protein